MSIGLSPASTHLVAGMSDGILSIRFVSYPVLLTKPSHRPKDEVIPIEIRNDFKRARNARHRAAKGDRIFEKDFLERGTLAPAPSNSVKVTAGGGHYARLKPFEELLKQFQYGRALDTALKVLVNAYRLTFVVKRFFGSFESL